MRLKPSIRRLIVVPALLALTAVCAGGPAADVAAQAVAAPQEQDSERFATRLLATVDVDALRADLRAELIEDMRRTLVREGRIGGRGIVADGDVVRIELRDASRLDEALERLRPLKSADASVGGTDRRVITVKLRETEFRRRLSLATEAAVAGLSRRMKLWGVQGAVVSRDGEARVRLEASTPFDPTRLRNTTICRTGFQVERVLDRTEAPSAAGAYERILPGGRDGVPAKVLVDRAPALRAGEIIAVRTTARSNVGDPTIAFEPNAAASRRLEALPDIVSQRFVLSFGDDAVAMTHIAPLASGGYGLTLTGLSFERAAELAAAMHGTSPEPQLVWLAETNAPRADDPSMRAPK